MVKPREEVISEFNILTNMSVDELQEWLLNPQSKEAGTGVGLESAKKIVGILKKNPTKDPEQYDDVCGEHGYARRLKRLMRTICTSRMTLSICAR